MPLLLGIWESWRKRNLGGEGRGGGAVNLASVGGGEEKGVVPRVQFALKEGPKIQQYEKGKKGEQGVILRGGSSRARCHAKRRKKKGNRQRGAVPKHVNINEQSVGEKKGGADCKTSPRLYFEVWTMNRGGGKTDGIA